MRCNYITAAYDKKSYDTFICRLGERCGISEKEMNYVSLEPASPVTTEAWSLVKSEEPLIVDVRTVSPELATILYGRYARHPWKTFLLLNAEQESAFEWGYGAGMCEKTEEDNPRRLARLQRDIAFFFSLDREEQGQEGEPVRELLERYWKKCGFDESNWDENRLDFEKIETQEERTGEAITARLKACAADEDLAGFKQELRDINGNDGIDDMDYIMISKLCEEMKLVMYRVRIMEQGYRRWKDKSPRLLFELIDAYVESPNRSYREKALELAEQYFGIRRTGGDEIELLPEAEHAFIEENYVKSLFNAYIGLGRYDAMYQLTKFEDYFADRGQEKVMRNLFLRNRAICLREKGDYSKALHHFRRLYEEEATENTLGLIAMTCENAGRGEESARLSAVLLLWDYDDVDRRIHLAEIMAKNTLKYAGNLQWQAAAQVNRSVERQAVPLLLSAFAIESNQRRTEAIHDVYRILDSLHDRRAVDFLRENRSNPGYLWSSFRKEYGSGKIYDFSLVDDLSAMYDTLEEGQTTIEAYIKQALPEE